MDCGTAKCIFFRREQYQCCIVCCCIFTACSFAAGIAAAGDKSANEAKNLQGTWQAIYLEANGKKSPDDQVKELQIVFKGDQVFAVKPEGEGQKCKFRLGTSKTLNTIDLIPIDG